MSRCGLAGVFGIAVHGAFPQGKPDTQMESILPFPRSMKEMHTIWHGA